MDYTIDQDNEVRLIGLFIDRTKMTDLKDLLHNSINYFN